MDNYRRDYTKKYTQRWLFPVCRHFIAGPVCSQCGGYYDKGLVRIDGQFDSAPKCALDLRWQIPSELLNNGVSVYDSPSAQHTGILYRRGR